MAPYVYTWKNVLITLIFNLENQAAKEDRYNMILFFFFLNIGSQAHKTLYFSMYIYIYKYIKKVLKDMF